MKDKKTYRVSVRPANPYTTYFYNVRRCAPYPKEDNVIHIRGRAAIERLLDALEASEAGAEKQKEKMESYPLVRELHTPEEIREYFGDSPSAGSPVDLAKPSSTCMDKIEKHDSGNITCHAYASQAEINHKLKEKNKKFFDMIDNGILPPLYNEGLEKISKNGKNW